jgi:tetratricopeptide (TPR) repeat protein
MGRVIAAMSAKQIEIDPKIRIGALAADRECRTDLKFKCSKVGLKNIVEFESGREVLSFLETATLNMLFVFAEVGDMHWTTFLRTLRSSKQVYFVPIVFVFPKAHPEDEKNLDLFDSYGVRAVIDSPFDLDTLMQKITEIVNNEQNTSSYQHRMAEAQREFKNGLNKAASEIFMSLVEEDQKDLTARSGLVHSSLADPRGQANQLMFALQADPENYNFQVELLTYLMRHNRIGQFTEAFDDLMGQLKEQGETFWLLQLGNMCVSLKLLALMGKVESELARKLPLDERWRLDLFRAQGALIRNDVEKSKSYLDKIKSEKSKKNPEVLNLYALIHKRNGHLTAARDMMELATKASPQDYRLLYNLGLIQIELGQKDEALKSFNESLLLRPDYERAKLQIAKVGGGQKF